MTFLEDIVVLGFFWDAMIFWGYNGIFGDLMIFGGYNDVFWDLMVVLGVIMMLFRVNDGI